MISSPFFLPCEYTTTKHINCAFFNINTHLQNETTKVDRLLHIMEQGKDSMLYEKIWQKDSNDAYYRKISC